MKKFFGKFPIVAIAVIVGVCSVSITAYAYYRLTLAVDVSAIQTASCSMLVKVITSDTQAVSLLDEEEIYIESYKFTGKEGESGVTFCIVGAGTASSGYCEVIVKDIDGNQKSYYTPTIVKGGNHYFTILGNKDTEVHFISYWGKHDITDEEQIIAIGEKIATFVPVATVSPSPSVSPSPTPSTTPSASPTPTPEASACPTPSASPSAAPDVSVSPEASATASAAPSEAPTATPMPTAEVSGSETSSPTPEVDASAMPSPTSEVDANTTSSSSPSAMPEPTTEVTASPKESPEAEEDAGKEKDIETGENNDIESESIDSDGTENSTETGNDTEGQGESDIE